MRFFCLVTFFLCFISCNAEQNPKKEAKVKHEFTNKLINETSPYLLQHAHNPVNWYPWGEEAFAKAKKENKPILVSIGYAACHWCHVMEHESFENKEVAKTLNDNFICIKVDREERPDVDKIYMNFLVMATGRGGWPLNVFITPEGEPFYGGTYFPAESKMGRIGFKELAGRISDAWKNEKDQILARAKQAKNALVQNLDIEIEKQKLNDEIFITAANSLTKSFDKEDGGFGSAPKFPPSQVLEFLIAQNFRSNESHFMDMSTLTFYKMAMGGMYDQIGGGFHRYSTDKIWLVPHFEKMLYDNAVLVPAFLNAYKISNEKYFKDIALETLDYIIRDMQAKDGGYYSSQDADSEKVEGKYYTWEKNEIDKILGEHATNFNKVFGVDEKGNFDSEDVRRVTILNRKVLAPPIPEEKVNFWKKQLLDVRYKRIHPLTDDKILSSWNGMMISAMCQAYRMTGSKKYLESALKSAEFIFAKMYTADGTLLRTSRLGKVSEITGFLDDYADMAEACTELYESTFEKKWLEKAVALTGKMDELFSAKEKGGYYFTPSNGESLIARSRSFEDSAVPNPNATAAWTFIRLYSLTGDTKYRIKAESIVEEASGGLTQYPRSHMKILRCLDALMKGSKQIIIAANSQKDAQEWLNEASRTYHPSQVVLLSGAREEGYMKDKKMINGKVTAYICFNQVCKLPITDFSQFLIELKKK